MTLAIITEIEKLLGILKNNTAPEVAVVETDIDTAAKNIAAYVKANIGPDILAIAQTVLVGAISSTPWNALEAAVITQAEAAGKTLVNGAARVALNFVQNQQIVTSVAPVAPVPAA